MGSKDSIFWETIHTFIAYLRFLPVSTIVHMGNSFLFHHRILLLINNL